MADDTLIVSVAGIVVSGVVGPAVTAWTSRRAARKQFNRDQEAGRRDELRRLLDKAAQQLGLGPTHLRRAREGSARNDVDGLAQWSEAVFSLGQRLELRLGQDDPVVVAFDNVRRILAASDTGEVDLPGFEAARDAFLEEARSKLEEPISDEEPT